MIEKLPNRDDKIYKEIENFEDYELSNCIAYEMAIRHSNVKKLLKQIKIPNYHDSSMSNEEQEKESNVKLMLADYGFGIFETFDSPNAGEITTSYTYKSGVDDYVGSVYTNKSNRKEVLEDRVKEGSNILHLDSLALNFARPELSLNYEHSFKVNINLSLPKDELIAFITKIKDDFDKDNSIVTTSFELLGKETLPADEIKDMPKKDLKKVYADMFFVYDYINYLEPIFCNSLEKLKSEMNNILKEINQRKDLDKYDKKSQIEEIKEEYKIDKKEFSKDKIKIGAERIIANDDLIIRASKVERYYKIMKQYIDELKYKELITNIKTSN